MDMNYKEVFLIALEMLLFSILLLIITTMVMYSDRIVKYGYAEKQEITQSFKTLQDYKLYDNQNVTKSDVLSAVTKFNGEIPIIIQESYSYQDTIDSDGNYNISCDGMDICLDLEGTSPYWQIKQLNDTLKILYETKYYPLGLKGENLKYKANIIYASNSRDVESLAFTLVTNINDLED